jgi:uncharacterized protein
MPRMKHLALIALAALLFIPAGTASAQSFNCRYAQLPAEVAICNSDRLQSLDQQMASLYFSVTNNAPGYIVRQVRAQQRSWLNVRNSCGYDQGCLRRAYNKRINQLDNWADQY